jgi:hypothetical protein
MNAQEQCGGDLESQRVARAGNESSLHGVNTDQTGVPNATLSRHGTLLKEPALLTDLVPLELIQVSFGDSR